MAVEYHASVGTVTECYLSSGRGSPPGRPWSCPVLVSQSIADEGAPKLVRWSDSVVALGLVSWSRVREWASALQRRDDLADQLSQIEQQAAFADCCLRGTVMADSPLTLYPEDDMGQKLSCTR